MLDYVGHAIIRQKEIFLSMEIARTIGILKVF